MVGGGLVAYRGAGTGRHGRAGSSERRAWAAEAKSEKKGQERVLSANYKLQFVTQLIAVTNQGTGTFELRRLSSYVTKI